MPLVRRDRTRTTEHGTARHVHDSDGTRMGEHIMTDQQQDAQTSDLPAGLAKPAQQALAAAGYQRLDQLTAITEIEFRQLHGIGPKAVEQLRRALSAKGLAFAGASIGGYPTGNYAEVNGLRLYYESHGGGEPLILLHGGLGMTGMFGDLLPALAADRQVIAVDLQAHGRTADIDRPLRYELMGDDIAALIRHLGLEEADLMGYSLGGGVALRAAIQHPDLVRKLVIVSTPFSQDGWYPEIVASMAQMSGAAAGFMKESPMYQEYARIAPRPEDFPVLLDKVGDMLRQRYDWTDGLAALTMPTLLVFGDADSIPPAYIARFFGLLGGGKTDGGWDGSGMSGARLAILPGVTHYNIFSSPLLVSIVRPFLAASPSAMRRWGE
jgi:pimeloyl-ACP methyl ester carboxylesterase